MADEQPEQKPAGVEQVQAPKQTEQPQPQTSAPKPAVQKQAAAVPKKEPVKQEGAAQAAQPRPQAAASPAAPRQQMEIQFVDGIPARVKEFVGRTGMRGEGLQVRCQVLEGRDKNKTIRRNVKGPVRVGDMLMLTETEIEAQKLNSGRRG